MISNLLEKTNNVKRSAYVWNAINAVLSACQCPVILLVITRTNGMVDAGIFSIAFAVASLMLYVGLYGLRRFQASDVMEKYSFQQYHGMRFITSAAMIIASAAYCFYGILFNDYSWSKFTVVFMICMLKLIQAYSDVIHGRMQQKGRLDVATKCSSVRYVLEVLAFIVMLIITRNLVAATFVCVGVSVIVLMLTTVNVGRNYCELRPSFEGQMIKQLTIEGFPLFVSLFLNMYISNAPKYAIDAFLTEEIQAYYNIIFMPAFMVGLIANFIFNPILTSYAELWMSKTISDLKRLEKLIVRQCFVVLGLSILGLLIAYTIGIPVLSWIFSVDLSPFRNELCVVMMGGGMLAYSMFFSTVVTIIRMQAPMLICYAIAALCAKIFSKFFVVQYGIMGAAAMYGIIMTLLSIMLAILMIWRIRKEHKLVGDKFGRE